MINLKVSLIAFMVLVTFDLTGKAMNSSLPVNHFIDQTVTIQQGQTITLHAASVNGVSYQWLKDGTFINGAIQANYVVSTAGSYQVIGVNGTNCTSNISAPVIVNIQPATPEADMQVKIIAASNSSNMEVPVNYTIAIKNNGPSTATNIVVKDNIPDQIQMGEMTQPTMGNVVNNTVARGINWNIEQLESGQIASVGFTAKVLKPGSISNTATVSALQTDPNLANNTSTATIEFTGLNIPNVFTPNGDNINDTFVIPGLEAYSANEITIINRWGSTVFQKKGYNNDWNGSGLVEGTYFYVLRVQMPSGEWNSYKGYVTLLRSKLSGQ